MFRLGIVKQVIDKADRMLVFILRYRRRSNLIENNHSITYVDKLYGVDKALIMLISC